MRLTKWMLVMVVFVSGCEPSADAPADQGTPNAADVELSNAEVENLVKRSYQYIAMYNVNNKFAMDPANPASTGGWNRVKANTDLLDHTVQAIARPNNDTLYIGAMLDVTEEPVILEMPAFDSTYVSLMVTGYDHYVNVPMSTRLGDFAEPARVLFYSARTPGYAGEAMEGIDKVFETTGDFISAVFRVMPHSNDPARLERNREAMRSVELLTLSEYRAGTEAPGEFAPWSSPSGKSADLDTRSDALRFPPFGESDFDIFEDNLLEAMQFVFNHTTLEQADPLDQALLDAWAPLGIAPGRTFDSANAIEIDGAKFRDVAERVAAEALADMMDPAFIEANVLGLFKPKGEIALELLLVQSVVGPIGLPAVEAVYSPIGTTDGAPLNAMYDYVIRMSKEELPPATAFWSTTLYDSENGFFIPNDHKKYSIGENAGMQLDADGGIEIHIAAEQPEGVPDKNWLPLERGDYGIDVILRIYAPDLERFGGWSAPVAERVE